MTETDDVRDTPEEAVEAEEATVPEEEAAPEEPEAGPREIAVGIVVIAVMLVGLVYSYNQGLETGTKNGRQEVLEETPRWVEPLRDARVAGGIRLSEGQEVRLRIAGPGEAFQDIRIADTAGESVVILVRSPEEVPGGGARQ
jgi:hypothetical protein